MCFCIQITALNVTGDTVVSCIIAQNVPLTEVEGMHEVDPSQDSKKTKDVDSDNSKDEVANA